MEEPSPSPGPTTPPDVTVGPVALDDPRLQRCGFAKLVGEGVEVFVRKFEIVMGRNSKSTTLDVVLGDNMNISRQHAKIVFNFDTKNFELIVLGKNGVTVEDVLYTPESPPQPLRSQDLLVIGDKKLHFLLPKTNDGGGGGQPPKRRRVSGGGPVASATAAAAAAAPTASAGGAGPPSVLTAQPGPAPPMAGPSGPMRLPMSLGGQQPVQSGVGMPLFHARPQQLMQQQQQHSNAAPPPQVQQQPYVMPAGQPHMSMAQRFQPGAQAMGMGSMMLSATPLAGNHAGVGMVPQGILLPFGGLPHHPNANANSNGPGGGAGGS